MSARATLTALLLLAPAALYAQPTTPAPTSPSPVSSSPVSSGPVASSPVASPPTSSSPTSSPSSGTGDDGYCDFVEGAAAANAATRLAPEVFGDFGYIEQPGFAVTPGAETGNLRALGGVRYSLTNIFVARATKSVASADCRKHRAQLQLGTRTNGVLGAAAARGLAAKLRIYEEAQAEAQRILTDTQSDLEARRLTAPEAFATRMRVEDLRSLAAQTRIDIAAIPPQEADKPISQAITDYVNADADVERAQARLRSLAAYDVSVRAGVNRDLEGTAPQTDYFAVVRLTINLGTLMTGSGNRRAARGRARYVRTQLLTNDVGPNLDQVRAMIDAASKRSEEVTVLLADLDRQMTALSQIPGDDSKRFRQTLWFDAVKVKAELASLQAHVAALREIAGTQ